MTKRANPIEALLPEFRTPDIAALNARHPGEVVPDFLVPQEPRTIVKDRDPSFVPRDVVRKDAETAADILAVTNTGSQEAFTAFAKNTGATAVSVAQKR